MVRSKTLLFVWVSALALSLSVFAVTVVWGLVGLGLFALAPSAQGVALRKTPGSR